MYHFSTSLLLLLYLIIIRRRPPITILRVFIHDVSLLSETSLSLRVPQHPVQVLPQRPLLRCAYEDVYRLLV